MSPEPFDSRAKAPPAKRWEKGYGDENGGVDVTSGELNKFVELALSMLVDRYSWYIVFMQVEALQPLKKRLHYLSHAGQNYWMLISWDRGHFFLIKRALLVIRRAWLLDADWLSTPALNWFPASNGFWKGISETLFSDQKRIDSQPENSLSRDCWCWTGH